LRWVAIAIGSSLVVACSLGRPAEDATGEEIYSLLCSQCHGDDLEGGVGQALGPGSDAADEGDGYFRFTIVNGRGRMPSFSSTLTDDQVDRLIGFLREAQGR